MTLINETRFSGQTYFQMHSPVCVSERYVNRKKITLKKNGMCFKKLF